MMFGISYFKIGAVLVMLAVVGLGYWRYTSLVDQVSTLMIELSEKEKELKSAKAAVDAMNDVMKAAEAEQVKSSTLRNAVSAARPTADVVIPKPLANAFLNRFGGQP